MHRFYASFHPTPNGPTLRKDTRAYLIPSSELRSQNDGKCVGTIWMHNPGSAKGSGWNHIQPDATLHVIAKVLDGAVIICGEEGKPIENDDYVQILNLHYVCGANPVAAWNHGKTSKYTEPLAPTSRFIWMAWGKEIPHGLLLRNADVIMTATCQVFGYDRGLKRIITNPEENAYPAHPLSVQQAPTTHHAMDKISEEIARHL